jgi:hypothetical protein
MNTNNAVLQPPIRRRSRPFRSLLFAVAGALILTAVLAPRANATCLTCPPPQTVQETPIVYFDFENDDSLTDNLPSVPPPGPGGLYPLLQNQTITKEANSFEGGSAAHFMAVDSNLGTNINALSAPGYTSVPQALDTGGQTLVGVDHGTQVFSKDCFQFSANTTGYTSLCLSFALKGTGGYTAIQVNYSTNGGATFTNVSSSGTRDGVAVGTTTLEIGSQTTHHSETFATITNDSAYHLYNFNLNDPALATSSNTIIEICLSGSTNSANANHTYFDNIVVGSETCIPEPTSAISGVLSVVGLCWYQRRRIRLILPRCGFRRLRRA